MTKTEKQQKKDIERLLGNKYKDTTWDSYQTLPKSIYRKVNNYFFKTWGLHLTDIY